MVECANAGIEWRPCQEEIAVRTLYQDISEMKRGAAADLDVVELGGYCSRLDLDAALQTAKHRSGRKQVRTRTERQDLRPTFVHVKNHVQRGTRPPGSCSPVLS
jgi:hypothetical protein